MTGLPPSSVGRGGAFALVGALAVLAASSGGVACQEAPPAYPSALIVVDTDLPVPAVLSRLQVDVYDERGKWVQHRRFALTRAEDWPASFGVVMRDDTRATSVLVRIRGFASGGERDYRGERYSPRPADPSPKLPGSLAELCANAPDLPMGRTLTQRVGPKPLFKTTCDKLDNYGGSVAAFITVPKRDRYRFEIIPAFAENRVLSYALAPTLHLVADCTNPSAFLGCSAELDQERNVVAQVVLDVDPGRYALVTGTWAPGSVGDTVLTWGPASEPRRTTLPPPAIAAVTSGVELRLHREDGDQTPLEEPAPEATVDRLVRIDLNPGAPANVNVALRGKCAGTMAKLVIENDAVRAEDSETCTDDPTKLVRARAGTATVADADVEGGRDIARGGFAAQACAPDDSSDDVVCVPGGAFALGSRAPAIPGTLDEGPLRISAVRRFWIDRHELTVGRYRAAMARGLSLAKLSPLHPPLANEGPLLEGAHQDGATFSLTPRGRESHALNAVRWDSARAICEFYDGDLPTEAQWERASTWSEREKQFRPWGSDPATCERTVVGRSSGGKQCFGTGPVAVDSAALERDVSLLGIQGLGGNVTEWVIGSSKNYDDPCWRAAPILDPVCLDETEPGRVSRGSDWRHGVDAARSTIRYAWASHVTNPGVGFRCAYTSLPAGGSR